MAKKKAASAASVSPKLTETEQDLLSHIQDGYQLETDSLGGNPILRRSKDDEGIRPLSANRNTIKAMEQRGLISPRQRSRPAHYPVASDHENKVKPVLFQCWIQSIRLTVTYLLFCRVALKSAPSLSSIS
jgi:hypothetical protein